MRNKKLMLSELIEQKNIKFKLGQINLIQAPVGCGKSYYIQKKLLKKYVLRMNKVLYLTDTTMLKRCVIEENANYIMESNTDIWKNCKVDIYFENALKENVRDMNKVSIMCYHRLAALIKKYPKIKHLLENKFELIICDEFHNLSKYAEVFDGGNGNLKELIEYLQELCGKTLVVGLTATPYYIYKFNNETKVVNLTEDYQDMLRSYKETYDHFSNIFNYLKKINWNVFIKGAGKKVLIYTKKIKTEEKIVEYFKGININAEYLCTETKLSDNQREVRDYIIKNKEFPKDLEVLVINNAYECGWNLENLEENSKDIEMVIVDSKNLTTQIQVRGRVRHDIMMLVTPEYEEADEEIVKFTLPSKYTGIKLTSEIKNELVMLYATNRKDKKTTWITFKEDLKFNGYKVLATKNGSYIVEAGEDDNKEENNDIKEYLDNIVDKRLDKKGQQELINKLNIRDDENKQQRQISTLNAYLNDNYNMQLVSKRVRVDGKQITVWEVSNR